MSPSRTPSALLRLVGLLLAGGAPPPAAAAAVAPSVVAKALRGAPGPGVAQAAFLDELEEIIGSGGRQATELRLGDFQAALQSTFVALPKTANGGISASSARYAIHRLFIQLHGWYIKGLAPGGGSWAPSVPALGMAGHLPERLKDLFEHRFGSDDFDLKELALITASIEALVHGEAIGRLHATYKALGMDPEQSVSREDAVETIYTCMTTGYNISQLARAQLESTRRSVELALDSFSRESGQTRFTFMDVAKNLKATTEQVGHRVDEGFCQSMEDRLVQMQDSPESGRVPLSDFYAHHLDSSNEDFQQFQQRPEYLRRLGALDESDPTAPRIIIPNYLLMQGNCLNVSSYYDLCCVDLCEDVLDTLERSIRAPSASPATIVSVLSGSASAYSPVGRNFSEALVKKLDEVAAHHAGTVPLHGRLFSQWMHFAYPIECAYPHLSGATKPFTYSEWFEEMGTHAMATEAEMQSIIDASPRARHTPPGATQADANASAPAAAGAAAEGPAAAAAAPLSTPRAAAACGDSEEGLCMWVPEEELVDAVNWPMARPSPSSSSSSSPPAPGLGGEGRWVSAVRAFAFAGVIVSSFMVVSSLVKQSMAAFRQAQGLDDSLAKGAKCAA